MRYLLAVLVMVLTACEQTPPAPPVPRPALVVSVGEQTTATPMALVGEIRSRYETAQGFRIDGKIIQRLVDVGSEVKKGQVLAKLDSIDTGLTSQAAQAEVKAAEADLDLAQAELDRYRQLHQRKFVATQALEIQEAKFKAAAARVKEVKAQAAVSGNQSNYTQLVAERDGVVTEIRAEPGQVVIAGDPVVHIAMPSEMEVAIAVPESRMQGVAVGTAAEVRLWTDPKTVYPAKVREVAPAAESVTRTFRVRVALGEVNSRVMRLGMTAGVRFYYQNSHDWLLPMTGVTQRDGQSVVWVVNAENGEVQPKPVQIAGFREDGVLISQGLQAGDQVVIAGLQTLVPGQVVRPTPVVRSE